MRTIVCVEEKIRVGLAPNPNDWLRTPIYKPITVWKVEEREGE